MDSTPLDGPYVARLWTRMAAIYGHRWTAPHGESADAEGSSGETWAKGLGGLSGQQLAFGLGACITRADPWPPTLPEFRCMCLGVPTLLAVTREINDPSAPRTPFGLSVAARIDLWAYRRAEERLAGRILGEAYAEARDALLRGLVLPEVLPALEAQPAKPVKPAPRDVAMGHLADMRAAIWGLDDAGDEDLTKTPVPAK